MNNNNQIKLAIPNFVPNNIRNITNEQKEMILSSIEFRSECFVNRSLNTLRSLSDKERLLKSYKTGVLVETLDVLVREHEYIMTTWNAFGFQLTRRGNPQLKDDFDEYFQLLSNINIDYENLERKIINKLKKTLRSIHNGKISPVALSHITTILIENFDKGLKLIQDIKF